MKFLFKFSRFPAMKELFLHSKGKNSLLFMITLISNTIAAFFEGISFAFILLAFSALSDPINSSSNSSSILSFITSKWFSTLTPSQTFSFSLILAIVLQILRSSLTFIGQIGTTQLAVHFQMLAQQRVYKQILALSFPCVSRYKVGDLLEHAKTAALLIPTVIDAINRCISSVLGIGAFIWMMLLVSPSLTLLALIVFGLLGFSQKFIIEKISHVSRTLSEHAVDFSKHTTQSLNGLKVIHLFHRQSSIIKKINQTLIQISQATKKLNLWTYTIPLVNEIMGVSLVGIFLIAGQFLIQNEGQVLLPLLLTFVTIVYRLNNRLQTLIASFGAIASNWGQILRLEEILSKENKQFIPSHGSPFHRFSDEIAFHKVTLRYEETKEPAICQLNLTFRKGYTTALVGTSGAGKSSLIDLLLRLHEPTEGMIKVDGVALEHYEIGSWREKLGVVSQDIFIFNETIEDNIRFGSPFAPMEKIIKAAQLAGAHLFIQKLPEGYKTVVGERGYRLSGGERQRIALARALIRDPEILILDEATSNLDSQTESFIQGALDQLQGQKTILIVAHRLSTIQNADQIFVLEKGQLIEKGSHKDLLALAGKYASLWKIQSEKLESSKATLA